MIHSASYGSLANSTMTMIQTPSPHDRRIRSSNSVPDMLNKSTTSALKSSSPQQQQQQQRSSGTTPRNVRFNTDNASTFSTSRPSFPSSASSTSPHHSSAPLTRVLSNGGTPTNNNSGSTGLSTSPPRLPIARSSSSSSSLLTTNNNSPSTPARFTQTWNTTPIKSIVPASTAVVSKAVHGVQAVASSATAQAKNAVPIEHKSLPPLTRQQVAKRLRTNSVMLVLWWISSRTQVYSFTSNQLVHFVPSLSAPLNLFEKILFILLCYNIADSMRSLNNLSSLAPATPLSSSPIKPSPSLRRVSSTTPQLKAPVHSSPKTRPTSGSPSASPTPIFRASARNSPQPPSPQTPTSINANRVLNSSALRNSYLGNVIGSPAQNGSPLSGKGGIVAEGEFNTSWSAYKARHEPLSPPKVSVSSKEAIDRIFDS